MDFSKKYEEFIDKLFDFLQPNFLYLFCFCVYFLLSVFILGWSWSAFFGCVLLYSGSIAIVLTPVGEIILRLINNVRRPETKEEKDYLLPIFEEVYEEAKKIMPKLPKMRIHIKDSMEANAFACGSHTISVTKGAMATFSEEQLKAILLHEIAHISYNHTRITLITLVANGFFSILVLLSRIILNVLDMIKNANNENTQFFILNFIISLFRFIFELIVFVCMFLFSIATACNSRKNELDADYFAYACGYGEEMIEALYLMQSLSLSENMSIVQRMNAHHPRVSMRIEKLETLGDEE